MEGGGRDTDHSPILEPTKGSKKSPPESSKHLLILVIGLVAVPLVIVIIRIAVTAVRPRTGNQQCSHSDTREDLKAPKHSTQAVTQETSKVKPPPCEDDWIWSRGKCYYFSDMRDTWTNSRKFCNEENAYLALIDNEVELKLLNKYKGEGGSWIGLSWDDDENAWTWTNGTVYTEQLFSITSISNNSDKSECVFLSWEGVRSQNGEYENKWICAKPSAV
ncbi:C-type lectin domain family 2 member A-like [Pseudophryne corroboree]|uniref:C-type lectin domain family 2 member A-like n=1 Tax=Pseudophryne corroboree TaxID=495146 RepID=UPI003081C759